MPESSVNHYLAFCYQKASTLHGAICIVIGSVLAVLMSRDIFRRTLQSEDNFRVAVIRQFCLQVGTLRGVIWAAVGGILAGVLKCDCSCRPQTGLRLLFRFSGCVP